MKSEKSFVFESLEKVLVSEGYEGFFFFVKEKRCREKALKGESRGA